MDLTNQTQMTIENKIFTLGSPITHADTLSKLLYIFQQEGITGRPIVIINPAADSIPDFNTMLENYIENCMQGMYSDTHTTYMFQDADDETIIAWANQQYVPNSGMTLDYLIETGRTIREQSRLKQDIDSAQSRRNELWRQHCSNPNSDEGSEEYANLSYNVIPGLEAELSKITEYLGSIPKNLDKGTKPISQGEARSVVENGVETVEKAVENTVETVETVVENTVMVGTGNPSLAYTDCSRLIMPLSVAKQVARQPAYQSYVKQQSLTIEGYKTVPIENLIALGVTLHADGVPIVYTKTGTFRRIGDSNISILDNDYWYPKPKYN